MIFYLLRHGRSFANEANLVTGTPADTLAAEGLVQVMRMKTWLEEAGLNADRYVTSQWNRAQQTALCLAPDADWKVDVRVGETDAGAAAEWTLARFLTETPDFYSNPTNCYPGGESHLELNRRVLSWFHEQLEQPSGALMLVAHSGPIACILQHVLGMGMERFPALLPAHASLSIVKMSQSESGWSGRLLGFSMGPPHSLPSCVYTHDKRQRA
jgi:broad specificity phosphatase PhoE